MNPLIPIACALVALYALSVGDPGFAALATAVGVTHIAQTYVGYRAAIERAQAGQGGFEQ